MTVARGPGIVESRKPQLHTAAGENRETETVRELCHFKLTREKKRRLGAPPQHRDEEVLGGCDDFTWNQREVTPETRETGEKIQVAACEPPWNRETDRVSVVPQRAACDALPNNSDLVHRIAGSEDFFSGAQFPYRADSLNQPEKRRMQRVSNKRYDWCSGNP